MNKRAQSSLILIFTLSVLISACTGTATQAELPLTATATTEAREAPTNEVVADDATDAPTVEPTQEEVVVPTEASPKPVLKTALVATNPGSVNLTSGKPTLVEFFAFW
jgi:hypothetical protein